MQIQIVVVYALILSFKKNDIQYHNIGYTIIVSGTQLLIREYLLIFLARRRKSNLGKPMLRLKFKQIVSQCEHDEVKRCRSER